MLVIVLVIGVIALVCYYASKEHRHWEKKNVPTGKVTPIFGDSLPMLTGQGSVVDMVKNVYNKIPNSRYIGSYQFQMPSLFINCPELIKKICVKDFDHFLNHRGFIPDGVEELWSKNLMALKGQNWKNMRATLSPSFTASKMKMMFVLMSHNANLFAQYFLKKDEDIVEIEFKDAFTRYTNDVIASTSFGVQVDSLEDRDNEFYVLGRDASNFASASKKFTFMLYQVFPTIGKLLKLPLFGKKVRNFFTNIVKDTIKMREEQDIKRPDMLGLLLEARKGKHHDKTDQLKEAGFAAVEEHLQVENIKLKLDDSDIISQLFLFFVGGFETVSSAMCFMAHELAANPDVQTRLIEEIDEHMPKDGMASYETIANMNYMDMVVCETLRKWPVNIATDRVVTKAYTIEPELPGEKPVHLDVGDIVILPIIAIHHDPKYYENPEKFDPERFSHENRNIINPYTYIPFGVGPRNCIGSRFAILEVKAVFFYLLSNFEIVPTSKTDIPLKLNKNAIIMTSANGFHMGLKRRTVKRKD